LQRLKQNYWLEGFFGVKTIEQEGNERLACTSLGKRLLGMASLGVLDFGEGDIGAKRTLH